MSSYDIALVADYTSTIQELLCDARDINRQATKEQSLRLHELQEGIEKIYSIKESYNPANSQAHFAAIETAFRNIFYELLASRSIEDNSFNELWSLLDIISFLSDSEHCEPALVFWLAEELLDSQTIDGCRKVLDYLDSRREQMTAKHFKAKHLVILRACNELLRRLSRAEDTVFCGRVFIYLFQSFPLGDRSSVNLRGEFHVDNVTVFDDLSKQKVTAAEPGAMDVDTEVELAAKAENAAPSTDQSANGTAVVDDTKNQAKMETKMEDKATPVLDIDTLYPIFWKLQDYFSTPTKLFEASNSEIFKSGLQATLDKFRQVNLDLEGRNTSKTPDDNKRGAKRKRGGSSDELASSFNPKYLTSRDLFELEVSDLAFRRHVLVQSLILIDFLLSLSPKAKMKMDSMSNKSVLYPYTLQEDDVKWAIQLRAEITTYLQQGMEGKFYYRMVDTVLSRDKNWVRWKAESCPPIQRPSVSAEDFLNARVETQRLCAAKRLRSTPLGSLDLRFLDWDSEATDSLQKLTKPERYAMPDPESFRNPLEDDDFEVDTRRNEEDRKLPMERRASKLWRMLRMASKSKLNRFDKIEDGGRGRDTFAALFETPGDENGSVTLGVKGERDEREVTVKEEGPEDPTTASAGRPSINIESEVTPTREAVVK